MNQFQFHKGTIKAFKRALLTLDVSMNFNSIKVQLKHTRPRRCLPFKTYFNSIKVQLKLIDSFETNEILIFQFHKGTIKACLVDYNLPDASGFQFHKGTIKAYLQAFHEFVHMEFQFHKGTIKAVR